MRRSQCLPKKTLMVGHMSPWNRMRSHTVGLVHGKLSGRGRGGVPVAVQGRAISAAGFPARGPLGSLRSPTCRRRSIAATHRVVKTTEP
jgi:hypothetical protein